MCLCGGCGVVVEVVDDEGVAVWGEVDVELEEKGDERGWCGSVSGEAEQDVAVCLDEVEEDVGC